jgi:hypothetical protein
MKSAWVIAAVMTVLFVPSYGGAVGIFSPEMVFSTPGQELASNITLDQAPQGISGYNITISLQPSGIAHITRVEFPKWAVLSQTSLLPSETVRILAVNLQGSDIPPEGCVELARIYAVSSGEGTVTPYIVSARVENISGDVQVSITPAGTVQAVAFSEGGMGSISYTGPDGAGGSVTKNPTTQSAILASPDSGVEGAGASSPMGPVTTEETPGKVTGAASFTPTPPPTTVPGPGPVAIAFTVLTAAMLIARKMRNN